MALDAARAKSLFLAASDIAEAAERAAYVDRECGGDVELRARVDALLRANDAAPLPPEATGAEARPHTANYGDPTACVGSVLAGKYRLVEEVGEGGMGTVYTAQQTEPVRRAVAVKVVKPGMDSKLVLARFEAERQALALMDHPNIARVLDAGTTDGGRPFFVMELVKGTPITRFCDERKLTPQQRLELFVPVCQAIQHAHQKGIIHRDIKPSNVLVALYDDRPVPKVIDFGVAKATGPALTDHSMVTSYGAIVGTPEYMSPEQAGLNKLDIDTRSDVYALGVLLYELLTGSPPFSKKELEIKGLFEILRVVREEEPPRPSDKLSTADALPTLSANRGTDPKKLTGLLRSELDWIVMKALEKDRSRRYETANGFAADVNRYLASEPVLAHPPSPGYRLKKFVRRYRPHVIASALVLLALVGGVTGTTIGLVRANRATEAERQAKLREEDRAEGERQAKLDADARRREAERNLAFAKKGNAILGSVFTGLDPSKIAESGRPLQDVLRQNLAEAVKALDSAAIGDPLEVAAMQTTLARSLLALGEAPLAAKVLQKSWETRKARLGRDHPDTVADLNNLAVAFLDSGQTARAVPLLEEALEKLKAKRGPDHLDTLASMNNLASAYKDNGQFDKAIPLFEETLKKVRAIFGPDDPNTLTTMNNLAWAYDHNRQLDRALPLFEVTLKTMRAKLGPDHPDTLNTMSNLGSTYRKSGQVERAVTLLQETLTKRKVKLGPDHPDTLTSMNDLALAYQAARQLAQAVPLFEEALDKMKARLGPDHPDTLITMNNLAVAYRDGGQLARAVALFEETLDKMKGKLGPEHPATLNTMSNLASAYEAGGQLARAVSLFEVTVERRKAKLGPDHPDTLSSMAQLGRANAKGGQGQKAASVAVAYVDAFRKRLPKDSPEFAGILAQVSFDLLSCGQQAAAEPLLRECLAIREKAQPDDWTTFNTRSMLGSALCGQKKYAEAEPLLFKGYEGMKQREEKIPKEAKVRLVETVDRLIELYAATNKPDEAAKWRAERAKYPDLAPPREAK